MTRSKSSMAAFVFPKVVEQLPDDDSGLEGTQGSLTGSNTADVPAVRTKKAGSKGISTIADQHSGRKTKSAAMVTGNPTFMWAVSEDL